MKHLVHVVTILVSCMACLSNAVTTTPHIYSREKAKLSETEVDTTTTEDVGPSVVISTTDRISTKSKSQTPLRVCVMVEPSPFTYVSGYANRFKELLRHMERAQEPGDAVEIITAERLVKDRPTSAFGFPVHHTKAVPLPFYSIMSLSVDWTLKTFRTVRKFKPNLIHASSPGMIILPALLCSRIFSVPLIASYHTHVPIYVKSYLPKHLHFLSRFVWFWIRMVHSFADLTIVTSSQIKEEFDAHKVPRVEVWKKGIDTQRFNPRYASAQMRKRMLTISSDGDDDDGSSKINNDNDCLLLFVGRLASEKRIKDCKGILERIPDATLCIVGAGPEGEHLRAHFKGTKTCFMGELHGDELSQTYASADIFLFPSDSETLGFVIMEALASKLPVVSCNRGGIPSMIRHGENGFLMEPNDEDGYVEAIQELKSNPKLRTMLVNQGRFDAEQWSWADSMSEVRDVRYRMAQENYKKRLSVRIWRAFFGTKKAKHNEEMVIA